MLNEINHSVYSVRSLLGSTETMGEKDDESSVPPQAHMTPILTILVN